MPFKDFKKNLLPREKGAYGIMGEPILLGLLCGFSLLGLMVALAAVIVLFAREPVVKIGVHYRKHQSIPKSQIFLLVVLWAIIGVLLIFVLVAQQWNGVFLIPLLIAFPVGVFQLFADYSGKSRKLSLETVGAFGPGAFASSIALAGEVSLTLAFLLWFIASGRSISTILYVRTMLRMRCNKKVSKGAPILAHYLVLLVSTIFVFLDQLPQAVVFVMAMYVIKSTIGINYPNPAITIKKIGYNELAYGIIGMTIIGISISQ